VPPSLSNRLANSPILTAGSGRYRHWVWGVVALWSVVVVADAVNVASAGVTGLGIATVAVAVLNVLIWILVAAKRRSATPSE
jgi:hypothetical protein